MEIRNYQEELLTMKKLATSTDKYGKPLIIRNQANHTMKVNPNIEPALLVTLLNYIPRMCNPDEACMSITTTEFAEIAYINSKEKEYNLFIKQVNTLIDKYTGLAMYKKAKESKKELTFPDFTYFFGEFSSAVDTDYIDKAEKIQYSKNFISSINECIIQNEIQILKTPSQTK